MDHTAIHTYKRVYVWEEPVRIFHWLNVLAIVVLSITGVIIANPPAILSNAEATQLYWFGTVRFIHFAAAYIFLAAFIYRIAWMFLGNKYASWRVFLPFSKKRLRNLLNVLKIDIFMIKDDDDPCTNISVGHNAMASLSYLLLFVLMFIQVATGFGLYADNATWWLPGLFAWVPPLLGGDAGVRLLHHIIMWLIIVFAVIHVYLVLYHDWLEGRGEVSSMFGGYKFVRKERVKED